ncbi:uncharacterized protein LOC129720029 [Wyeomyia smithii]|uniref:uncharacterized protein LOC129720029 n=1 Tax=Wyeomyia smithii TaxID=174621 RepID=UPI002467F4CD|nr:uncharacterized protein LOC129720029 [Wyeomyia smithii]
MATLLSLGPKFSFPINDIKQIPLYHLIANLESILRTSNEKTAQDRNRSLVVNKIQNFLSRSKCQHNKNPLSQFCCRAAKTTKEFLRKNPEVCVLESDKGKRMVVMYTKEYDQKMEALLDSPTYTTTKKDPTAAFQRNNNSFVSRLLNLKLIDTTTATRLRTYTAICPRIYGQPKAHKAELPLRPVVPNITAPTYALSKYVANILQQAFISEYNISDSFEFARYINTITLPPDYVLVSFDVVSLFTNVPQDLIMQIIIHWWPSIRGKTKINLDLFLEMVVFCLKCSYFQFRDKYYLQQTDTAMGSPLSPILADMVMEDLICNAARKLSFTPPVLKKYVDDLILALPKQETLNTLGIFNGFHPNLQFTMEEESNGALPYLDTKRVTSLTTNNTTTQHKQTVFQHLRRNSYPSALINRLINRTTQSFSQPTTPPPNICPLDNTAPETTYRSMINIPVLSSILVSILKKDHPLVKIALKTTKTTRNLLRQVTDPIDPQQLSNVIYTIPCSNCEKSYIGMTKNHLKTRISGHRSNINKLSASPHHPSEQRTALTQHIMDHQHTFNLSNTKIVDRSYRSTDLPILEMCHIYNTPNTVNFRTDVDNLNTTYAGILHTYANTVSRRSQIAHESNRPTDSPTDASISDA